MESEKNHSERKENGTSHEDFQLTATNMDPENKSIEVISAHQDGNEAEVPTCIEMSSANSVEDKIMTNDDSLTKSCDTDTVLNDDKHVDTSDEGLPVISQSTVDDLVDSKVPNADTNDENASASLSSQSLEDTDMDCKTSVDATPSSGQLEETCVSTKDDMPAPVGDEQPGVADMEYRSAGDAKPALVDDSGDDESDGSTDDDTNQDAEKVIEKTLTSERDFSPERKVKLNRHGFEDVRTKGEILPEELPPLEELTITVDETVEMVKVGTVASVVGVLVVVKSEENVPPLNDDTILFVEGHKVMGQIFEVFGPVQAPWYSVRFNDAGNITTKGIEPGTKVFCAPKEESFTKFVFVDSLKKMKGSDASWEDNNEPPEKHLDYSDDEQEKRAKAKRKNKNKVIEIDVDDITSANVQKKNRKNAQNWATRGECIPSNSNTQDERRGRNPFRGQQGNNFNSTADNYCQRPSRPRMDIQQKIGYQNWPPSSRHCWPPANNRGQQGPPPRFGGPPNFQNQQGFENDIRQPFGRGNSGPNRGNYNGPYNRGNNGPFNGVNNSSPFNGGNNGPFNGGNNSGSFNGSNNSGPFNGGNNAPFNGGNNSGSFNGGNNSGSFNGGNNGPFSGGNNSGPFNGGNNGPFNGGNNCGPFNGGNDGPFNGGNSVGPFNGGNKSGPFNGGNSSGPFNGGKNGSFNLGNNGPFNGSNNGPFSGGNNSGPFNGGNNGPFNGGNNGPFSGGNNSGPFNGGNNGPFNGGNNGPFNGGNNGGQFNGGNNNGPFNGGKNNGPFNGGNNGPSNGGNNVPFNGCNNNGPFNGGNNGGPFNGANNGGQFNIGNNNGPFTVGQNEPVSGGFNGPPNRDGNGMPNGNSQRQFNSTNRGQIGSFNNGSSTSNGNFNSGNGQPQNNPNQVNQQHIGAMNYNMLPGSGKVQPQANQQRFEGQPSQGQFQQNVGTSSRPNQVRVHGLNPGMPLNNNASNQQPPTADKYDHINLGGGQVGPYRPGPQNSQNTNVQQTNQGIPGTMNANFQNGSGNTGAPLNNSNNNQNISQNRATTGPPYPTNSMNNTSYMNPNFVNTSNNGPANFIDPRFIQGN